MSLYLFGTDLSFDAPWAFALLNNALRADNLGKFLCEAITTIAICLRPVFVTT